MAVVDRERSRPVQPEENKTVVRRFLEEIFTAGNLELVDELFAPDYVLHDPVVPDEVSGPEGMKRYVSMYRSAYPDTHFTVEDQIAEGDKVVTRWTGQGTQQGELMGIPPTGERVTITGITVDRLSGGKIEEEWNNFDQLGLLRQLGVAPG
jgi:steroid delta-isomerase-like uncharacterized protein